MLSIRAFRRRVPCKYEWTSGISSPGIQCSRFILPVSSQIPDNRKRPSPTSEAQMPNAPSSKEFDPLSKKSHQDPSKVMSSFGLSNDTGS